MRRTKTLLALEGIVDDISWPARKWSRKRRMHVWESVHAGPNCVAGLKALRSIWAGGLDGPTDPYEDITIGAKQKARGQTSGNAMWQATLWTAEDEAYHGGGLDAREEWADVLRCTHMRPDASLLIQALCLWYGCQQQKGVENVCGDSRCQLLVRRARPARAQKNTLLKNSMGDVGNPKQRSRAGSRRERKGCWRGGARTCVGSG